MPRILKNLIILLLLANFALPVVTFGQGGGQPLTTGAAAALTGTISPAAGAAATAPYRARQQRLQGQASNSRGTENFVDQVIGIGGEAVKWISTKAIGGVLLVINYLISFIAGAMFTLAGILLNFTLSINLGILDASVVLIGWRITRDIANLGFVVAIIIIAFATMLRFESYGAGKLLARLIGVALLINFSLAIAGLFIDISHLIANFFILKSIGDVNFGSIEANGNNFVRVLSGAFQPQKIIQISADGSFVKGMLESLSGITVGIASMVFVALYTVISALAIGAVGVLLMIRYVALTLLLVLLPLALLCSIFPDTEYLWKDWRKRFLSQVFFLPLSLFFVYLSLIVVSEQAEFNQAGGSAAINLARRVSTGYEAGSALDSYLGIIQNPAQKITEMLVILSLLMGGLYASNKLSIAGSSTALSLAKGIQKWTLNRLRRTATAPGRFALERALQGGYDKEGVNRGQRLAATLQKIPILRGLAAPLGAYAAQDKTRYETYAKEYAAQTKDARQNLAQKLLLSTTILPADRDKAAGLLKTMIENGEIDNVVKKSALEGLSEEEQQKVWDGASKSLVKVAKVAGLGDELLKVRPDLAPEFDKTIEKAMSKVDVTKVSGEALKNINVLANLTPSQMENIEKKGSADTKKAIRENLGKRYSELVAFQTAGGTLTAEQLRAKDKLKAMKRLTLTRGWTLRDLRSELHEEKKAKIITQLEAAKREEIEQRELERLTQRYTKPIRQEISERLKAQKVTDLTAKYEAEMADLKKEMIEEETNKIARNLERQFTEEFKGALRQQFQAADPNASPDAIEQLVRSTVDASKDALRERANTESKVRAETRVGERIGERVRMKAEREAQRLAWEEAGAEAERLAKEKAKTEAERIATERAPGAVSKEAAKIAKEKVEEELKVFKPPQS